jgi:hypothetical protein
VNSSSTGLYYTYVTNGTQYEVTSLFESQKYKSQYAVNPSIPDYPEVNAKGSSLTVNPLFSTSGLVGYWNLDEGTGTTAYDTSGSGNTGIWSGTTPYYASGKVGPSAGSFDGTDDYVNISSIDSSLSGSQGAIALWAYPMSTATSTTGYIFSSWGPSSNRFYISYYPPPSNTVSVTRSNPSVSIGLGTIPLNSWYHITLTWNSSMMYGYLNGNLIASSSYTNSSSQGGNSTIGAYQDAPAQLFPGKIDDVRIYNRALSAAEVQGLYNAEK